MLLRGNMGNAYAMKEGLCRPYTWFLVCIVDIKMNLT